MFSDTLTVVAVVVMVAVAVAGVFWVFVGPHLTGEARAEKRRKRVGGPVDARRKGAEALARGQDNKRKQVEQSLKELERKKKAAKSPPLPVRIEQAGLKWSKKQFFIFCGVSTVVFLLIGLMAGVPPLVLPALLLVGGVGFPRWLLGHLKTRRQNKFLLAFPDAVDVIVRGIKAGLPLNDCLRVIAHEAKEPVKTEFVRIIEAQALGLSVAESVARLHERVPLPETNFFVIVVTIQQQSGGNLAEALGNLSKVLRDRKKMKGKITALSQEAKVSAAIIGSLPLIVMMLLFFASPDYVSMLWTEQIGQMMLAGCAIWMMIGVLVMRQMINFKF